MKTKKYVANNGDEEFMNFFYNRDEKGWYEWEFTESEECKRISEELARIDREIELKKAETASLCKLQVELMEKYNVEFEKMEEA